MYGGSTCIIVRDLLNRLKISPVWQISIVFLMMILIVPFGQAFGNISFDVTGTNLSNSVNVDSTEPKVLLSGSNVFVIWKEDKDIFFSKSSDGGASFDTAINLSGTPALKSEEHQFVISGNNVYVVWREFTTSSDNDIFFVNSTDGGVTFPDSPINLSNTAGTNSSRTPQIATSNDDVYVAWREGGSNSEITFVKSSNRGDSFGSKTNLSNFEVSRSHEHKLGSLGDNVYLVWRQGNSGSDIYFRNSVDRGLTFNPPKQILSSALNSQEPQIAFESNNVYLIWEEGTSVFFSNSKDAGASFSIPVDFDVTSGDADPTITASGSDELYVAFQDTADISIKKSTDAGDSFSSNFDLSETNMIFSVRPDIGVEGTNVFTVWQEGISGDSDILLRASGDSGSTYGGISDISDNGVFTEDPQLGIDGGKIVIVWSEESSIGSGIGEIMFTAGSIVPTEIKFNATQFKLGDTAKITVTDTFFSGSVDVTVTSDVDSTGFVITLQETGANTGIFEGTIDFTTESSSGTTLEVSPISPNDSFKASFNGVETSSSIFPRTIEFDASGYNRGSTAIILVTDNNANTDVSTKQSVDITISSKEGGSSIPFTLQETGPNSGKFGGVGEMTLLFSDGDDKFPDTGSLTVTVEIPADKKIPAPDPAVKDTGTVKVTSTSDPVGFDLTVTEDAVNSNIYKGNLILTTGFTNAATNSIQVSGGDILTVKSGEFPSNAVIVPSNPEIGLLPVKVTTALPDTITATYLDVSVQDIVKFEEGEPGGGGGGLVRPGLVLNALAGTQLFTGGGSGSSSPPSISTSSIRGLGVASEGFGGVLGKQSLDSFETNLIEDDSEDTQTKDSKNDEDKSKPISFKKNEEIILDFDISESIDDLKHATLYMNEGDLKGYLEKYSYIRWTPEDGLIVNDKEGIFSETDIEIIENDLFDITLRFKMKFDSELDESDVMLHIWNNKKQEAKIEYDNAFTVKDSTQNQVDVQSDIITPTSSEQKLETHQDAAPLEIEKKDDSIPSWVKTSAMWWSEDQINDKDFVLGIEHLVKEEIIEIPATQIGSEKSTSIPSWIKSMAGWWSDGGITDDEFKQAVEWLIQRGVMKV